MQLAIEIAQDRDGNRISSQSSAFGGATVYYNHDDANQLTDIRSGSTGGTLVAGFVYDANGNLTKKCEGGTVTASTTTCTGSTITDLTHDFLNRPVQIAKTGISTQTYKYDDSGRRIQKVAGSAITNFLYDGAQIASQYTDVWTSPTFNYTYGPGADAPTIRASGTTAQYYHQNGIGNVVGVTNQAGVTEGTASYNPYGIVTTTVGSIPTYGFTGREPDETGLVYFRARYYDPAIGRFIQRDPIGFNGGINFYAYVGNSPVNFTDPTGQFAIVWHWGITFIAALNKGYSLSQSWDYAAAAAGPDKLGGNTFSDRYSDTIQHATSGVTAPNPQPPPPNVALVATEVFIDKQLQSSSIVEQGRGIHAAQDTQAVNHMGKPWPPEGGLLGTLWHFVQDIFPSFSSIGKAYDRTLQAFDKIQANKVAEAIKILDDNGVFDGFINTALEMRSDENLGQLISMEPSGPYSGNQPTNEYVGSNK